MPFESPFSTGDRIRDEWQALLQELLKSCIWAASKASSTDTFPKEVARGLCARFDALTKASGTGPSKSPPIRERSLQPRSVLEVKHQAQRWEDRVLNNMPRLPSDLERYRWNWLAGRKSFPDQRPSEQPTASTVMDLSRHAPGMP
jgi:hypothetical protein